METLESIKEGKLYWEDSIRTYGEHLLAQLQRRYPDKQMVGRFSQSLLRDAEYNKVCYTIREGSSRFIHFNPLAKKLVRLSDTRITVGGAQGIVSIFDEELREDATGLVTELNEKTGKNFKVIYSS